MIYKLFGRWERRNWLYGKDNFFSERGGTVCKELAAGMADVCRGRAEAACRLADLKIPGER
jgi:hypothetical protein